MGFFKYLFIRTRLLRALLTTSTIVALSTGAAQANWNLPSDAINNVGDFANCTFNAGTATVTCSNSVNLNATNATLTLSQDLTIVFAQGINTPDGITINPGSNYLLTISVNNNTFNMNGNNAIINANISGGNITVSGANSVVTGNLSATNNVTINAAATVFGNVVGAGSVINNGTVNGNVSTSGSFTNNSSGTVNGNVTAAGSVMNNGLVSSNIDAGGSVTNNSGAVAGSINANGSVTNNGTVLSYINAPSISGDGTAPVTCDINVNEGPCAGAPDPNLDYCTVITEATTFGIVGSSGFTYGSGSSINDNTIEGAGNTPTPVGQVDTVDIPYPPIDPPTFPNFSASTNISNQNIGPGTYNEIEFRGNSTFTMSAGTYYIKELEISRTGNGTTVIMGAGDYFIEDLILHSNTNILTSGGIVRLFIKNGIGRSNANQININSTGNVGNFRIFLYEGASISLGNGNQGNQTAETLNFNGIIYGPSPTNNVNFGNNNNIQGSILAGGQVNVGNNTEFNYSPEVQAEIVSAYECDPPDAEIDHYRIRHPFSMVSCYTAPVLIDACADAICSALYEDPVQVTLSATATSAVWQGGDIIGSAGNPASLTLNNGSGVIGLQNVPGGSTSISISATTVAAINPTQCFDSTGTTATSCTVNFQTAGLIFTDPDGSSPIDHQFAGSPFDVALRAVETNTTTGACEARVSGLQTVNMGVECINPSSCISGQTYQVDNTPIGFNANGVVNNFVPVDVNFDANGTAILPHNYSDVGLLRLHASLQLTPEPNPDNPDIDDPPIQLTGTSTSEYVVKPYSLIVRALDDNGDLWTDVNAGYRAAGEDFSVVIQSLNADNLPTPNFGNEMPEISLSATLDSVAFPTNGTLGNLTQTNNFSPSSTIVGAFSNDGLRWSEVGTVNLVASLAGQDYLGGGDAFNRPPSPVGRFYPHHFELRMNSANVTNACIGEGFTYMGQPNIEVEFIIDAVNLAGQVTTNYGRAEYNGSAIVDGFAAHDSPAIDLDNEFLERFELTTESNEAWENGSLSFSNENLIFSRFSQEPPDGPYPQTRIGLQIRDEQDSRNFLPSALALETAAGLAVQLTGELNIIYGRLVLENTYGPEGEDLPVDLRAQYWSGSRFETHTADQCTPYQVNNLALLDASVTDTQPGGIDGNLVEGAVIPGNLLWLAPTTPEPALEFEFEYDAPPWLEFNWEDADNNIHRNPRAFGSFGQFRGNDRIIFWLELR